jgi:SAM-dependent methyltransferase
MKELNFDSTNLKKIFREIGLYNPNAQFYAERAHKHQQVFAYIIQIKAAFSKLSTKRPIVLLDCGCGKSYLSFILYEYCKTILEREPRIIGIDNNADLICKCKKTAEELKFKNMEFYNSSIEAFNTNKAVDIVYSLHACDTATDQTIAKGVLLDAKYIFSVSCCQHTNRHNMQKHPLQCITRHQPYKERLADMAGDSMRALILEHLGYGVKLFEFTAAEYTPKNIMLRAIKNTVKRQDQETAKDNYNKLVAMFNFSPALYFLIEQHL